MRIVRLVILLVFPLLCGISPASANPVPFVNQPLVPSSIKPGGSAFTLTVNSTGFVRGAVVKWNGSPRSTTFVNSSQLKAAISASDIARVETARVTVVNPIPGGGTSNVANFQVVTPHKLAFASKRFNQGDGSRTLWSTTLGDFNRDGILDLIGSNVSGNEILVALGNGDGTFQSPIATPIQIMAFQTGVVGDFNEDGKLDFAIINDTNSVAVFLGKGNGRFQKEQSFLTAISPSGLVVGDLNGDGHLDLAVAAQNANVISVLLGKGDGTFQSHVDTPTTNAPEFLTVGDFNRDGKLDLVAIGYNQEIDVMLGNGDGTFSEGASYFSSVFFLVPADMNGDGKLDLVGSTGQSLLIFPGNGDGTFKPPKTVFQVGRNESVNGLALADMRGNGILDLVTIFQTPTLYLLVVDPTGHDVFSFTVDSDSNLFAGDLNNDGRPDAGATAQGYWDTVYIQKSKKAARSAPRDATKRLRKAGSTD